ncbi:type III pantothenate kinase [Hydrogenimonas sp.]
MILCDVGNSRIHLYDGEHLRHFSHAEGLKRFKNEKVYYICVNERMQSRIEEEAPGWTDISGRGVLETRYRGLGADRKAVCLAICDGVVVDAGSAVTVDVMERGTHLGGWIWPGISAFKKAYAGISGALDVEMDPALLTGRLPLDTASAVNFAVFASVKKLVESFASGRPVTITGGDAALFAPLFTGAVVDELLVFRGMEKMIKEKRC